MAQKEDLLYLMAQDFFISGYSLEYIAGLTCLSIETIQLWKANGDWDRLKESVDKKHMMKYEVPPISVLENLAEILNTVIDALKIDYRFGCNMYNVTINCLRQTFDEILNSSSPTSPAA